MASPSLFVGASFLFDGLWDYSFISLFGIATACLYWRLDNPFLKLISIVLAFINSAILLLMFVTPFGLFSVEIADRATARHAALRSRIQATPPDESALLELISELDSFNAYRRAGAAGQLGWLALQVDRDYPALAPLLEKHAVPALIKALRDNDPAVREQAAEAFEAFGPHARAAVSALAAALQEGNTGTAWKSATALGNVGPDAASAVPDLVTALKSDFPNDGTASSMLRKYAAEALGNIGPKASAAIPDLRKALKDPDPEVRRNAESALKKIEGT
jgi:HEAT repeat protein